MVMNVQVRLEFSAKKWSYLVECTVCPYPVVQVIFRKRTQRASPLMLLCVCNCRLNIPNKSPSEVIPDLNVLIDNHSSSQGKEVHRFIDFRV